MRIQQLSSVSFEHWLREECLCSTCEGSQDSDATTDSDEEVFPEMCGKCLPCVSKKCAMHPDLEHGGGTTIVSLRFFERMGSLEGQDVSQHRNCWPVAKIHRVFVEICCGEQSRLCSPRNHNQPGCLCIRVTLEEDFSLESIVNAIKNVIIIYRHKVLLWFSIPCTGGCRYAAINASKSNEAKLRLERHWRVFDELWINAECVMDFAELHGSRVAIEWPDSCKYWSENKVTSLLYRLKLRQIMFHGCMFGLTSIKQKTYGRPIVKPWRVATNCMELIQRLKRRCPGNRITDVCANGYTHVRCSGKDTKYSEGYTDELACTVLDAFHAYMCARDAGRQ